MRRVLITGLIGLTTAGAASADPGIRVSPSIGINQLYTDNTSGAQKSQPDLVTQVSPGLSINGETPRIKVNLTYQPTFDHFDLGKSPDRLDQSLNGAVTVTPFDELTVDFKANANEAGASGNSTNQTGVLIPAANQVLYYIGTVTPHFQEHLGDVATLDAYYGLNSSNTSVQGAKLPGLGVASSTDTLGQTGELVLGSADSFGSLGLKLDFKHTGDTGSGMNTASTTDVDSLGATYHINRIYAVSGSVGYQATDYPTSGSRLAYHSSGLTWTLGVTFTPNDASSVALGYGFQQGAYNPTATVSYSLGPLTKISASYLVTIQNQLTAALQNLQFLTHDQFGNPIDSRTGLPFSAVNQTFGSQNVLFRDKPAILSLSHQFVRSAVTVTGQYEVRSSLTGPLSSSKTWGVSINYSQEFNPLLQGTFTVGYTGSSSSGAGALTSQVQSISLSASLFYRLSETTTVNVVENYFNAMSNLPANGSKTEQLTVGLRKSF